MAISKSTPYVRYKENFTSNLHLGTIHVESEYLDRTQKTTIESIHGMTWHNKVVNENKELDLLSNLGFELTESKKEYFNVGEQRVSVDEIHGMQDIEPNEDGTYTYSVTSIEGEYAEIYDGLNHITSTSDGLDGNFEIVYDTDEEDITGSVVLDATMPNYTIEDSNVGELNDVVFKGETLVNILPQPSLRNKMENTSMQRLNEGHDEVVVADGEYKSAILKGNTLVNLGTQKSGSFNGKRFLYIPLSRTLKTNTRYFVKFNLRESSLTNGVVCRLRVGTNGSIVGNLISDGIITVTDDMYNNIEFYIRNADDVTNGLDAVVDDIMLIEYQEGMENWDIPYFTGMQSVKQPVLTTIGKNLFDVSILPQGDANITPTLTGYTLKQYSCSLNKFVSDVLPDLKVGKQYVVSFQVNNLSTVQASNSIGFYNMETKQLSHYRNNEAFTLTNEMYYERVFVLYGTKDEVVEFSNVQIEEGSTATEYEPYKSNTLTVNEEVELRGIGDVKDELNLLTGELTQRVESHVLNKDVVEGVNYESNNMISILTKVKVPSALLLCANYSVDNSNCSSSSNDTKECIGISGSSYTVRLRINKTKLPSIDKNGAISFIENNPIIIQYVLTESIVKTVDLTVTDQDNVVLEIDKPLSYKDGHIQVQSNGILPSSISYEVPSQNHMYVDMLKPSNTYTLKRNGENFEGSFFIDGTEYNTNVFMTSHQLPNKSLIINDMSEYDKVAMFEGNYGTSSIPYFEGMTSVKMPVLTTVGKNLFNPLNFKNGELVEINGEKFFKYVDGAKPFEFTTDFETNKQYTITFSAKRDTGDEDKDIYLYVDYTDGSRDYRIINGSGINAMTLTTSVNKTISKICGSDGLSKNVYINLNVSQLELGVSSTSYEPHKSNILTTNEEVTLRAIGDVKDEYNVETGELTQRIGEAIYTEKESWYQYLANDFDNSCLFSCTSLKIGDTSDSSMKTNFISDRFTPSTQIFMNDIIGSYIQGGSLFIRVKKEWLSTPDVYGLQKYLQSNPITVQYQLAQPTTRKVISTILDQDGKQTHSMSTYTGLTNLSTSSDTLIPNVSLDYEISSSTGTVTGTSATIENGENGSPISAIVYGESLVNVIQEPSDVEYVALGEYSGNNITIENSVEGNIKNAVIKGNTLVNLIDNPDKNITSHWGRFQVIKDLKSNTIYTISIESPTVQVGVFTTTSTEQAIKGYTNGTFSFNSGDNTSVRLYIRHQDNSPTTPLPNEYWEVVMCEGDYANVNIPYFTGMQSVKMPVLTTTGKNLIDKIKTEEGYLHNDNPYSVTIISQMRGERTTEYIKVKPNTTYTYTLYNLTTDIIGDTFWNGWYYYKNIGEVSSITPDRQVGYAQSTYTFTTPSDCNYIRISSRGLEYETTDVMLSEDTSSVTYESYQTNTLTINEPIELRGIGDIKDELDLATGKLTQRIEEVELNILSITHTGKNFNGNDRFLLNLKNSISNFNELLANDIINNHCFTYSPTAGYNYGGNNSYYFYAQNQIYISFTAEKYTVETLRDLFNEKPFIIQLPTTTNLIKTIDLTVTDQDGNPTSLHSYNDTTHITTNSQGLVANVEISNPSYDVVLKANTKYTLKLNRTNAPTDTPLEINLGGTEATMDSTVNSIAITTPSTLANNKLTLGGVGNKFKEAMVIEGDCVDRDLDYFEGIVGVENPVLHITCKNLFNPKNTFKVGYMNWQTGHVAYADNSYDSVTDFIPIQEIEPGTYYFHYKNETNRIDICFFDENKNFVHGAVTKAVIPNTSKYMRVMVRNIKQTIIPLQMEKGSSKTEYEPYQGNTLATYPQVTLHSIGDIKDELDLVNETVTRRVGEVVLNGSEDWRIESGGSSTHTRFSMRRGNNTAPISNITFEQYKCNKFRAVTAISGTVSEEVILMENYDNYFISLVVKNTRLSTPDAEGLKTWLSQNPTTVIYLIAPVTESVYITPPTPRTSTASVTLSTQLGESDYVTWNPYKEHYVHYNYEQDGSYTWENLTDLNERQFIELYDRRTYVEQEYKNTFLSHDSKGTSKYVLIEPNQDYTVTVRFSELPQCETVKVNLGGSEVEMNVSDPHVHVTTPNTLSNYLCSISGKGLSGKITDILVIHCLEHKGFADIEYFEGIDSIGEVVDGKASIIVEQTNGNLIDKDFEVYQNGNGIRLVEHIDVRPNKKYIFKTIKDMSIDQVDESLNKISTSVHGNGSELHTNINTAKVMISASNTYSNGNGSTHKYHPIELCLKGMEKDYIRPRYNSSQEIILPMQLCRINTVYDNFYYDVIRGHYRIQQSIGHKYFTGADSENWTLIERGQRILRFRYNNADIQIKSLGEYMTNRFTNGTTTSPYESCAFNGSTFIISIDKERLSNATLVAFKEWLSSHNVHLYYQLASPMMIDLPQYSSKLELNTYKDEIYTFLKNCKPTVFTLDVPLDQTYRFYELQESQGYTNRIELTDERMTEEDALYINTIYGSGISNLIEEPNNVNTLLKPNYEGRATSHTLTNGKVSTIGVHGFEPNGVKVGAYNTVTKQYELTVKATSGENNNSVAFPIPYALEQYEDGTHDRVYYNSEYKQWMFEGGQTLTVAYNSSTGVFTNAIEIFRGMTPRSGMIGEFKVKFASGTTSARLYYSLDGSTYTYTTLRSMTDGVEYYIAFFNTGGTKIDMGTKIGASSEYTTLVPLSGTVSEALMINQIQSITECTYYLDKTYYYTEPTRPIELTVYEGTNTITENNGVIITIENNAHNKDALIYANTSYTVYWTHVGGQGNIRVTLGGVTQEVAATQGYVTITTSDTDLERGLLIGGFDVTIKDLMLVKGERIADLSYFEGSRAVGTAFIDEDGNTMYRITLVTGSELIQDKFEDVITFEDNKKHNVLVTKLLGTKPNKN